MKALKSATAQAILSDPNARQQLERYMISSRETQESAEPTHVTIEFKNTQGQMKIVTPVLVPKAFSQ